MRDKRTIVISESAADAVKLTEFKFDFYVRKFLKELLDDAVNATPADIMVANGFDRKSLIDKLIGAEMLKREQNISEIGDGDDSKAVMKVKFIVPRSGFDKKLRKLYRTLFSKTDDESINETDCASVGGEQGFGYTAPFGPLVTQGKKGKKKKDPSLSRPIGNICINKV
jgi:hypothetical protein